MADILASGQTSPLGKATLISDALGYTDQGSVPFPIELSKQGGMGFQFEGGIITVNATSPKINVSFDRPMTYNGAVSHVPGGTPYDVGSPALTADAMSLDIPITVNPVPASTNMTIYFTADGAPHGP